MSWLVDLANYIRDAQVDGIGSNVYVYTLKSSDTGIMLTIPTTGMKLDKDIPNFYKGRILMVVRSTNPQNSESQANAVSDLLNSNNKRMLGEDISIPLDSGIINYCYPEGLPLIYPRSDGDFYEASVNFDVCFVATS